MNKFDEYLVPLKGEIEARLPEELVGTVRGLATRSNLHPVNVSKIKTTITHSFPKSLMYGLKLLFLLY